MTTLNDSPGKAKRILYFIVFTLAFAVPNYAQYQFSPLGPQIIERFGLTGVQFNSIFTAPMLPAIFTSLISGMLVDRYGYKPVIGASILLTALGCWGRVFAEGYGLMYCAMILLGFSAGFLSSNSSKILSILFGQERVSVIMGLVLTLSTCGMVLSMSTTTALGISKAFLLAAVLASVVLVFWFVVMPGVRERRESGEQAAPAQSVTLGQALVTALKNRHVWGGRPGHVLPQRRHDRHGLLHPHGTGGGAGLYGGSGRCGRSLPHGRKPPGKPADPHHLAENR